MIIADTSVLSAFAIIQRIDLLKKILGRIYIPKAVFLEILDSKDERLIKEVKRYIDEKFISILRPEPIKEMEEFKERNRLGPGESEAILIAKHEKGVILLDDKRAREVAKHEKVECYGTLALLRICYEKRVVEKEELKSVLDNVIEKGNLYVTPKLYDWVLR
ncbi:MAG: hypothetical protein DRO76_04195 [Candidatus Altiarchaeales archaeon]|nr:MAG: hypothetical protein DRO76_04195 [Candidatus Altiarchaeales archaeon]